MKLHLTIGIIGDSGAMGRWLRVFFERLGLHVIGSSLTSALSNQEVVERSDVVIFAVTLREMVPIIRDLVPYSRSDQLWMDVGSRKKKIIDEMLTSHAEVVGLHPLCAPPQGSTFEKETVAFCPARLDQWSTWVHWIMSQMKGNLILCEPSFHDAMMLLTQNVPQAATMALAMALADSGRTSDDLLKFSTAASRKMLALVASMLANTPGVYADIQVGNPEGIAMLDRMIRSLSLIRQLAYEGKPDELVLILDGLRSFYGKDFIAAGKRGFEER